MDENENNPIEVFMPINRIVVPSSAYDKAKQVVDQYYAAIKKEVSS